MGWYGDRDRERTEETSTTRKPLEQTIRGRVCDVWRKKKNNNKKWKKKLYRRPGYCTTAGVKRAVSDG